MTKRVLFLCTGNYYRSRFAEAVFNYHAARGQLGWSAFSRGLAVHLVEGDLSPHTAAALHRRNIPLQHTSTTRVQLAEQDLETAQRIIALDEAEHRPLLRELFPAWGAQVVFWDVCDAHLTAPEEALPCIERYVLQLIEELRMQNPIRGQR